MYFVKWILSSIIFYFGPLRYNLCKQGFESWEEKMKAAEQLSSKTPNCYFLYSAYFLRSWKEMNGYFMGKRKPREDKALELFHSFLNQCAKLFLSLFFFFLFGRFTFSTAAPTAYGGSHPRGLIGAVATDLHQGHSNVGSQPHLWPTPERTATPDP